MRKFTVVSNDLPNACKISMIFIKTAPSAMLNVSRWAGGAAVRGPKGRGEEIRMSSSLADHPRHL